jgi:hypothetical protein
MSRFAIHALIADAAHDFVTGPFGIWLAALTAGFVIILVGSALRWKLDIDIPDLKCPMCKGQRPRIRRPINFRQAMLGGEYCSRCGTEMDRTGKAVLRLQGSR